MSRDFDDSVRFFARRHRLSPMAERELVELVGAVSSGHPWTPAAASTTITRTPVDRAQVTVEPADEAEPVTGMPFADRYEDLGVIGMGGMGEVRRVYDRLLQRTLAVKMLRWDSIDNPDARARFMAEAQVNAQLQHPGVVAVHEQGVLPDGRPWFTMKEVRGRTLSDAIRASYRNAPGAPTHRRLIEAVARVCRTVAYAHAKGVVHRDIKPANIMLGEFGEVLVMDWGIARVGNEVTQPRPATMAPDAVGAPVRKSASLSGETRDGRVMGTPAYMSPEQARGAHDEVGPASDVYALGAVLYHVLCGQPPFRGRSAAVLNQVLFGPPPAIADVRPFDQGPAPADLVALCERAMAREPAQRPTVEVLAIEIEGWLDGVLKAARAQAIVIEADAMQPRIGELRRQVTDLRRRAAEILDPLPDHAPAEAKRPGWTLEDAARDKSHEARLIEVRMLQTLRSALHVVPELPDAHLRLAAFYQEQSLAAEQRRDMHTARIYEELVRTHDRGSLCEWLSGDGRLTLVTDPPGARVTAHRFEARDRRLVEVCEAPLGETPLIGVRLARGSHMLIIEADGHAPVRYPVDIGRGAHWNGIPPDGTQPHIIRLPRVGELRGDDVYVPSGWCVIGGDDDAADSLSRRRVWLDGFVIRRFPVTNDEYIAYLDELAARNGLAVALARAPRATDLTGPEAPEYVYAWDDSGGFALGTDRRGWHWQGDWPVVDIDWHDASAYASWLAGAHGVGWRLCHGMEHEKAARGVDGRHLPWGEHFEQTWANVLNSRAGRPSIRPVGAMETDQSVYGVRDTVGNVRTWCVSAYRRDGDAAEGQRLRPRPAQGAEAREIRGGCWHSSPYLGRIAGRFGATPDMRYGVLGMRLARPFS